MPIARARKVIIGRRRKRSRTPEQALAEYTYRQELMQLRIVCHGLGKQLLDAYDHTDLEYIALPLLNLDRALERTKEAAIRAGRG